MSSSIREAWLGIRRGAPTDAVRATVFVAEDGCRGTLTECHITGEDSAHPGAWMFRLSDPAHPQRWHWEMSLRETD